MIPPSAPLQGSEKLGGVLGPREPKGEARPDVAPEEHIVIAAQIGVRRTRLDHSGDGVLGNERGLVGGDVHLALVASTWDCVNRRRASRRGGGCAAPRW